MKRKGIIIVIGFFVVLALAACALIVMTMRGYIKSFEWDIHETVTEGERDKLSYLALMPDAADDIEYYAVMGSELSYNFSFIRQC